MDSEQVGQWLPLKVAAPHLGVSVKTARRRARSGEVLARQTPTPYGEAWEVWVPTVGMPIGQGVILGTPNGHTQDSQATQIGLTQVGQGLELLEALRQLDQIRTELLTKAEAAAMWQARAEMLAGELADARGQLQQRDETIRALSAPRNDPAPEDIASSPDEAAPAVDAPHAPQPGRLRRAWRWLAGTAGP